MAWSVFSPCAAAATSRHGSATAVRVSHEMNRPKEKCLVEGDAHAPGVSDWYVSVWLRYFLCVGVNGEHIYGKPPPEPRRCICWFLVVYKRHLYDGWRQYTVSLLKMFDAEFPNSSDVGDFVFLPDMLVVGHHKSLDFSYELSYGEREKNCKHVCEHHRYRRRHCFCYR